ncbi:MAG: hypothetical protein GY815_07850 [Gammaproteobacteria bacterium]|nr:hypothetical protein [Gammaproteobacteria bacterium]
MKRSIASLILLSSSFCSSVCQPLLAGDFVQWRHYGGDSGNSQYSALQQVNRDNVTKLQIAWQYHSAKGEAIHPISELQVNSIVINGVLYGRNPNHNIFAIRADSGEELWTFDPFTDEEGLLSSYMRGLTYWQADENSKENNTTSAPRIFSSVSHYLIALDATSGKPIKSFGDNGRVNLKEGLGRDP